MKRSSGRQGEHGSVLAVGLLVLATLLILGAGFLVYRHEQKARAIANERSQYTQAEKDLDDLVAQITAKFGQPADQEKVKSCGYASSFSEVGHGDLYCSYDVELSFKTNSKEEAQTLSRSQAALLVTTNVSDFRLTQPSDSQTTPSRLLGSTFEGRSHLKCSSSWIYYDISDNLRAEGYDSLKLGDSHQGVLVELNCGSRPAKAAYYPIQNS